MNIDHLVRRQRDGMFETQCGSPAELDALFATLQHRAFRGAL